MIDRFTAHTQTHNENIISANSLCLLGECNKLFTPFEIIWDLHTDLNKPSDL